MNQNASQFIGSIPEHYDNGLGPYIFHDYGDDLAARAAASGATEILETAAGTGIVSRKLRDALPPHAGMIVTDLNPPMLAVAEGKFREEENATFQPADALDLPFDDNAFDNVLCMEVLEHLEKIDFAKALHELRRVTRKRLMITVPYKEPEPVWHFDQPRGHRQSFSEEKKGQKPVG